MGTLVELDDYRKSGNGAREVLQRYFDEWPQQIVPLKGELELGRVDHMLAWLWMKGFKIVPLKAAHAANTDD
jgi:hypothetical protein